MKWSASALVFLWNAAAVAAVPALVWHKEAAPLAAPVHTSAALSAQALVESSLVKNTDDLQVIFLVGRADDGSETLSTWTASGALPAVAAAASAAIVHHQVTHVQSFSALTALATQVDRTAMQITLAELAAKLEADAAVDVEVTAEGATVTKKLVHKRAKALAKARTLIVQVPATTQASVLDDAVRQSLVQASTTLLTAVRSAAEVKLERNMAAQAQVSRMADAGTPQEQRRRRLDDANAENGYNQNQQQDLSDIYYVSMTPNIMAGLLFFFLFTFVAYVGLTCMGMIAGQDVYVKRMPTIGREA
jgi:hypothetical protein